MKRVSAGTPLLSTSSAALLNFGHASVLSPLLQPQPSRSHPSGEDRLAALLGSSPSRLRWLCPGPRAASGLGECESRCRNLPGAAPAFGGCAHLQCACLDWFKQSCLTGLMGLYSRDEGAGMGESIVPLPGETLGGFCPPPPAHSGSPSWFGSNP